MQRVRIGLTGLAFVFLVVLLAAVFTNPVDEPEITPKLIEQQMKGETPEPLATAPRGGEPAEPLAELGVAPGKAESNSAQPKAAPPAGEQPQR